MHNSSLEYKNPFSLEKTTSFTAFNYTKKNSNFKLTMKLLKNKLIHRK